MAARLSPLTVRPLATAFRILFTTPNSRIGFQALSKNIYVHTVLKPHICGCLVPSAFVGGFTDDALYKDKIHVKQHLYSLCNVLGYKGACSGQTRAS